MILVLGLPKRFIRINIHIYPVKAIADSDSNVFPCIVFQVKIEHILVSRHLIYLNAKPTKIAS